MIWGSPYFRTPPYGTIYGSPRIAIFFSKFAGPEFLVEKCWKHLGFHRQQVGIAFPKCMVRYGSLISIPWMPQNRKWNLYQFYGCPRSVSGSTPSFQNLWMCADFLGDGSSALHPITRDFWHSSGPLIPLHHGRHGPRTTPWLRCRRGLAMCPGRCETPRRSGRVSPCFSQIMG